MSISINVLVVCLVLNSVTGNIKDAPESICSKSTECCTTARASASTTHDAAAGKPVVALILARGGSKGIPLKNLRVLDGASLLARALRVAKESGIFAEIWVSTDHDGIADEACKNGALVHRRPSNVSTDTTTSIASVQEFLHHHPEIRNLALIQCTSVFLKDSYLQDAFRKIHSSDCVFSVVRSWKLRWHTTPSDRLVPLNFESNRRPRRQDWSGELLETGMFYFARRELLDSGSFQNDKCNFVEVSPEDALEVDTPLDLRMATLLLNEI